VSKKMAIRTEGLTKFYSGKKAVDGLTFTVPSGSIFGFLGPNGAGKTTTFAMLCGFVRPHSGTAWVLDEPLSQLNRVRRRVTALPQDANFPAKRSIEDILRFYGELSGMTSAESSDEAERVLATVDLISARKTRGGALSHGMAKRLGIAQAFLGRPDLVLLDEPTEGLDPRMAHGVRQQIVALKGHATVLVSSHNLAEVQDICDAAAIIDHGRLVTQGSMADLTGADEQVIVTLGDALPSVENILSICECVRKVSASKDGHTLRIALKHLPGVHVENAVTQVLSALIAANGTIGSVQRGGGLEERFLELT